MNDPPDEPGGSPLPLSSDELADLPNITFSAPSPGYIVTVSTDDFDTDISTPAPLSEPDQKRKRKLLAQKKKDLLPRPTDLPAVNPPLVAASNENIPKNNPPIGRTVYNESDSAPYIIHVEKVVASPNDGATLHPVELGNVKSIGRRKITISFADFSEANSFLSHNSLESMSLKAYIPTFNVTRMGLVRGVPVDWSLDEVKANMSVPMGCGEIIKVRRLNFKSFNDGSVSWKPSQSVVITFDGQTLPKRVFICYNALPVDLYIYPTIQCFNCCRFGHTKTQCRSKPRCFKCGQGHIGNSCSTDEQHASCCLCSGFHFATSKSCQEFVRQKNIKVHMSENSVSYAEASKMYPPASKSYADILSSSPEIITQPINPQVPFIKTNHTKTSSSYKKTVFTKPRPSPPLSKGYDKVAHSNLIKDYSFPSPRDGCALQRQPQEQHPNSNLTDLIVVLINLVSQCNSSSPSNAAPIIENCIRFLQDGFTRENSPMELPEYFK
ncbi:hypothetical protein ABMA27_005764 [Loxostege sticticalis]|uniref:CCHC-type domain-containing protein n=1 Tax=Loxostege sticticalis TaxID=481309 RepID=A0ABR3HGD6_LOXSC